MFLSNKNCKPQESALTPAQHRLARALLRLKNSELAAHTGLHENTLIRAEAGNATAKTMLHLRNFYASKGIEFVEAEGTDMIGILFPKRLSDAVEQK